MVNGKCLITNYNGSEIDAIPQIIADHLVIDDCKNLKYFTAVPQEVGSLALQDLDHLKDLTAFKDVVIHSSLQICYCPNFISLAGCPDKIPVDFVVKGCPRMNYLKYGPDYVSCNYKVNKCRLKSLHHIAQFIGQKLDVSENNLTDIKYMPAYLGGGLDLSHNQITSLEGCLAVIYSYINISYNDLISLEFGPQKVYGDYQASNNKLKNVNGLAKYIKLDLYLDNNNIQDLTDWPTELVYLEDVFLHTNQLTNLDGLKLIFCYNLDLDKNKLTDIDNLPPIIKRNLRLSNNELEEINLTHSYIPNLYLSNNKLKTIKKLPARVDRLSLLDNPDLIGQTIELNITQPFSIDTLRIDSGVKIKNGTILSSHIQKKEYIWDNYQPWMLTETSYDNEYTRMIAKIRRNNYI